MLFAYFGPETFLPVTSIIAGVIGVVLMFGRNTFRFLAVAVKQVVKGKSKPVVNAMPAPHIQPGQSALDRRRAGVRQGPGTKSDES